MVEITVSTTVPASPEAVWADLRSIASHVEWMHDAESITFQTEAIEGVGVRFECVTKVGPIRLVDVMEVTEWQDGMSMGIVHRGAVTGSGQFRLRPLQASDGAVYTQFQWAETLTFPWWLAGPVGAWFARPVLKLIWKRNLRNFTTRFG